MPEPITLPALCNLKEQPIGTFFINGMKLLYRTPNMSVRNDGKPERACIEILTTGKHHWAVGVQCWAPHFSAKYEKYAPWHILAAGMNELWQYSKRGNIRDGAYSLRMLTRAAYVLLLFQPIYAIFWRTKRLLA